MAVHAIGDIHGCIDALQAIFKHSTFTPEDQIVFLGDYVDRGSDVRATFDFLLQVQKEFDCIFLRGNHEIMMKDAAADDELFDFWHRNGGKQTLESYGLDGNPDWANLIPKDHWSFMHETKPFHGVGNHIFVHAGLEPDLPLPDQFDAVIYWQKITGTPTPYQVGKTVVCGHTAQRDGVIKNWGHTICVDTCAYGGRWLSCLNCTTGSFIQASNTGKVQTGLLSNTTP